MKKTLLASFVLLSLTLTACNTTKTADNAAKMPEEAAQPAQPAQQASQDQFVDVRYNCMAGKQKVPVIARYLIQDGELVKAQVLVAPNQATPVLDRDLKSPNAASANIYSAQGLAWITDKTTVANVTTANGNMLQSADGKIILKYCDVAK